MDEKAMAEFNAACDEFCRLMADDFQKLQAAFDKVYGDMALRFSEAKSIEVLVRCRKCGHTLNVWPVQCPDCGAVGEIETRFWDATNRRPLM